MLPELTPAVARALDAAQHWAGSLGAAEVDPPHLLYGLLEEVEGRAAELLARAGVEVAAVRRRLVETTAAAPPISAGAPLPRSSQTEAILAAAHLLARETSPDRTTASGHVLLAILRIEDNLRTLLESLGLATERLEAAFALAPTPALKLDEPLELAEPAEQIDTARILDAAGNRAREALRVIEDYCRFAADDRFLTNECKSLRHQLREALADLPTGALLAARETERDVGTSLSTPDEQHRHNLEAVVQANLKRLQEALRSLEEFGKLHGPQLGQVLEKLRYRSYTLERAIIMGATARQRLAGARLYVLLTGSQCKAALDWTIQEAAAGGADLFQLREKELNDRTLLERARQVRRRTKQAGALFIMNDRPDIARLVEAEGVHLGQDELPIKEARRILGPDALIGVSTHNLDQVRQAVLDGASYIGVGPTFPSETKSFEEFPGLEFVRQATAETSLPTFVIGGVNLETIEAAVAAGAQRVAVSHAISQADDPRAVARALRQQLA